MDTVRDFLATTSPWSTQVVVENRATTPVLVYLARSHTEPTADNAVEHCVPPRETYPISSGWLNEPRATLLIRTKPNEAKVVRVPHSGRIFVDLSPQGLNVESPDVADIEDYDDPHAVPGLDTMPMVMRKASFQTEGQEPEDDAVLPQVAAVSENVRIIGAASDLR
mmetsp:Transcript_1949/g.3701  ORF Transcript_1949/g.3701 Transcript_1949/m.3701 type:complete len:166 (-) Transcript_1949:165-662(-)